MGQKNRLGSETSHTGSNSWSWGSFSSWTCMKIVSQKNGNVDSGRQLLFFPHEIDNQMLKCEKMYKNDFQATCH